MIRFDNSYARLPERMFNRQTAAPVGAPKLIAVNRDLAARLGIDADWLAGAGLDVLAGNVVPDGAAPLAQAYAGHQFGHWNPGLGDGRALLLGEVLAPDGARFDLQLKGSGPTPYSRRGDGRAWLGPVLREYIVSEAMAAMGLPTTRALAAVETGETVWRETGLPGAVLTRVAASHIRVGTFQLFAAMGDTEALAALTDHVIARHYPQAQGPEGLLRAVMQAQAALIARWMGVGFIHGVMNTDNMAVSGETIDYGPCAFMDGYHPMTVFSSIDAQGRYAYGNQPRIALWNLAQFATALLPLLDDREAAVARLTAILEGFPDIYEAERRAVFAAKLGLVAPTPDDDGLIDGLLDLMQAGQSDFTQTFAALASDSAEGHILDRAAFTDWRARWSARGPDMELMARSNPQIIPRNHQIEAVITAAVAGDYAPFHAMNAALSRPFAPLDAATRPYAAAPTEGERVARTFCGT